MRNVSKTGLQAYIIFLEKHSFSASFTWKVMNVSRMLFSSLHTIYMSIHSLFISHKMQFAGEQRIFMVTNYLKTRSFNEVLQLFEYVSE